MIVMEIDVSLINKDLFYVGYDGKKTLSLVLFESKKGNSDYIVKQGLSKEERENTTVDERNKMPILGNAKVISTKGGTKWESTPKKDEPW
jgi:hypothetical protein